MHYHGKGAWDQRVRIGPKAAHAVSRYLRARAKHKAAHLPNLWLADRGLRPLAPNGIKIMLKRRSLSVGLAGVHAHRWRHTTPTSGSWAGGDIGGLILLLGWTSEDIPRHYGEGAAAERAQAVQLQMRIGELSDRKSPEVQVVRAVTVIMAVMVGLTFLSGFGASGASCCASARQAGWRHRRHLTGEFAA